MSTTARPAFLIEFELGCALERRAIHHDTPADDMISRFQRDENEREIAKLTDELAHTGP
jgi:hypothetical protein